MILRCAGARCFRSAPPRLAGHLEVLGILCGPLCGPPGIPDPRSSAWGSPKAAGGCVSQKLVGNPCKTLRKPPKCFEMLSRPPHPAGLPACKNAGKVGQVGTTPRPPEEKPREGGSGSWAWLAPAVKEEVSGKGAKVGGKRLGSPPLPGNIPPWTPGAGWRTLRKPPKCFEMLSCPTTWTGLPGAPCGGISFTFGNPNSRGGTMARARARLLSWAS